MAFEAARLVSGRSLPVLRTADAYVAQVQAQHVGKLMQALSRDLPLAPVLAHLKRVRVPGKAAAAEVLLCLATSGTVATNETAAEAAGPVPEQAHAHEPAVTAACDTNGEPYPFPVTPSTAAALAAAAARVGVRTVPLSTPDTRAQWSEWSRIWPMPWRIPAGALEQDGDSVPAAEQAYLERHMAAALAASHAAGGRNVALIVNPANGAVLGRGVDASDVHPLDHAAMLAVEAVAARDRALWPYNGFAHAGRHEACPDAEGYVAVTPGHFSDAAPGQFSEAASTADGVPAPSAAAAQQQQQTQQQIHTQQQRACEAVLASAGMAQQLCQACDAPRACTHTCDEERCRPPCKKQRGTPDDPYGTMVGRRDQDSAARAGVDWSKKPYLCTGYDCFLVHEPCSMCSMALVHSRLARIVYCRRDTAHGALGGSYRMHAERCLNHHYKVYHLATVGGEQLPAHSRPQ